MLDSGKVRKTNIGPSPARSRGRFAHEPFSQPMPQPQGYKEELEKANGAIDSIKKALFHGSSLLPFFACLGGGAGRCAASDAQGDTRPAARGSCAYLCTCRRNLSLTARMPTPSNLCRVAALFYIAASACRSNLARLTSFDHGPVSASHSF